MGRNPDPSIKANLFSIRRCSLPYNQSTILLPTNPSDVFCHHDSCIMWYKLTSGVSPRIIVTVVLNTDNSLVLTRSSFSFSISALIDPVITCDVIQTVVKQFVSLFT